MALMLRDQPLWRILGAQMGTGFLPSIGNSNASQGGLRFHTDGSHPSRDRSLLMLLLRRTAARRFFRKLSIVTEFAMARRWIKRHPEIPDENGRSVGVMVPVEERSSHFPKW